MIKRDGVGEPDHQLTIDKKMGKPDEIVHSVFADPKMYKGKQVVKSRRPILTFWAFGTSNSFSG